MEASRHLFRCPQYNIVLSTYLWHTLLAQTPTLAPSLEARQFGATGIVQEDSMIGTRSSSESAAQTGKRSSSFFDLRPGPSLRLHSGSRSTRAITQ